MVDQVLGQTPAGSNIVSSDVGITTAGFIVSVQDNDGNSRSVRIGNDLG
jgi:hypothetical protein